MLFFVVSECGFLRSQLRQERLIFHRESVNLIDQHFDCFVSQLSERLKNGGQFRRQSFHIKEIVISAEFDILSGDDPGIEQSCMQIDRQDIHRTKNAGIAAR